MFFNIHNINFLFRDEFFDKVNFDNLHRSLKQEKKLQETLVGMMQYNHIHQAFLKGIFEYASLIKRQISIIKDKGLQEVN